MFKLTIDTNLINLKQSILSMNTLERWQSEGKVALIGTERLKMETENHPKANQKVDSMQNVSEPGVYGVSLYGRSTYGGGNRGPKFNELAKVLFPNQKNLRNLIKSDRNDIMHLMAHAHNGHDIFLTNNKKHFINNGRQQLLKDHFGIIVMTAEEATNHFSEKYGWEK